MVQCDGTPGPKPDPDNCHDYYTCTIAGEGWIVEVSLNNRLINTRPDITGPNGGGHGDCPP